MTRSYEDGILDCLKIMNNYRMSGIYDIPIKYIEEAINKLLTSDQKLDEMTLMPDSKKSLENPGYLDEPTYMSKLSQ